MSFCRTYEDFNAYLESNPATPVVEMDTVLERKGGKVLLLLFFRNCSLMIAILLDACTQIAVLSSLNTTYGAEFQAPESIENDAYGNARTIFYCETIASYQKPHIEKNHEYIGYLLPKGKSFDQLTQDKVTLMKFI